MTRRPLASVLLLCAVALAPRPARAQGEGGGRLPDSIAVVGVRRVSRQTVLLTAGLVPGRTANYRDIQHAIQALYASGQFDDIRIDQDTAGPGILIIQVKERPVVAHWTVRGVNRLSEHTVRDRAQGVWRQELQLAIDVNNAFCAVFGAGPPPNLADTLARSMLPTELLIGLIYVVMGLLLMLQQLMSALQMAGTAAGGSLMGGACTRASSAQTTGSGASD